MMMNAAYAKKKEKSMSSSKNLYRLNLRLPDDLKAWLAREAAKRNCAMNAVILDALSTKMNLKAHDFAVSLAISQLPIDCRNFIDTVIYAMLNGSVVTIELG